MRRNVLVAIPVAALISIAAFSQTPAPAFRKVTSVEGITEYALPNGLQVLLFPDPSKPKVTVNMTYLVGSRYEGYGETGMAHLLEHLLFLQTRTRTNIKKELTDHGARHERHHLVRPHQLLRDALRQRREPALGAGAGGRPDGQHLHAQRASWTRK